MITSKTNSHSELDNFDNKVTAILAAIEAGIPPVWLGRIALGASFAAFSGALFFSLFA